MEYEVIGDVEEGQEVVLDDASPDENLIMCENIVVPLSHEQYVKYTHMGIECIDEASDLSVYKGIDHLGLISDRVPKYKSGNAMLSEVLLHACVGSLDTHQLCALVEHAELGMCRDAVILQLSKYVDGTCCDTYVWNQISSNTEYTYYQYNKRNWPVKKYNNLDWQTIAKKIGLVDKVYPGQAFVNKNPANGNANGNAKANGNANGNVAAKAGIKAVIDAIEEKKDKAADTADNEFEDASDLDDDEEENADLLNMLDDKEKQTRRDEKLRKLRAESNYGSYSIPVASSYTDDMTPDTVNAVYDALMKLGQDKYATVFACKVFVSRKYWHMALKNIAFMGKINALMAKYRRVHTIIKYAMKYSIYLMMKEERLLGRRIKEDTRAIVDAEVFRSWPVFDCELEETPYFTEVYTQRDVSLRERLVAYLGGERKFTSQEEFQRRLGIMDGGMLKGIDLSEHGAFLTGSSMVPCVATNPLERNFANREKPFAEFIENYYPSLESIKTYQTKFDDCRRLMHESQKMRYGEDTVAMNDDDFVKYVNKTKLTSTLIDNLNDSYSMLVKMTGKIADLDIAIMAGSMQEYEKKVFAIFEKIKKNMYKDRPWTPDSRIYLWKKEIKYGFKYVLTGPGAKRPIDFFKIFLQPHALLHRFHLNVVRYWWDGKKLRALGSAVCASLTGVNQWYRWFSNNKDPMAIVLKNMQRGYTTLLNTREVTVLRIYVSEVNAYKHLDNHLPYGKIHHTHVIFGHEGGIRYNFPELLLVCNNYITHTQYWGNYYSVLDRIKCDLKTNHRAMIIPPKIFAFPAIVSDLMGI
jgi:hypothetical protein